MTEQHLPRSGPAWVLGAAAAVLYLLTAQRRLYGDGLFFQDFLRQGGDQLIYNHMLFLPLVWLVQQAVSLVHDIDGERAMKVVAALAGGYGVGMTWMVAAIVLRARNHATIAALFAAGMVGYWFHSTATELHSLHAACATTLLWCLLRVIDRPGVRSGCGCLVLCLATSCTPGSHVSGVGVVLPLAYVFLLAGPDRRRFGWCVAAGLAGFGLLYLGVMFREGGFSGFTKVHVGKHTGLLDTPSAIPGKLLACLAEFGLYSLPALVLLPAGLRVLFRTARRQAWLCVLWLLAWPLLAWPVDDRAFGSYYVPTYPVQAVLAVVGMYGVARSWLRVALVVGLGVAPSLSLLVLPKVLPLDHETAPLLVAVLGSALLFRLAGAGTEQPRGLFVLPAIAGLLSVSVMPALITVDRHRDRLAEVQAFVDGVDRREQKRSLVVFLATNTVEHHHWAMFFDGDWVPPDRAFNPVFAALDPERERIRPALEAHLRRVEQALAAGRPVFVVGTPERAIREVGPRPDLLWFCERLAAAWRLEVPAGAPPQVSRLRPR